MNNAVLVIDGAELNMCLREDEMTFFKTASKMNGVICCRCSPLQKAQVVKKMKEYTGLCIAAIGDGGNDVGMIQEADVGIGIVGKEGKQASLAADFSVSEFNSILRLLLWHGRVSYLRTALLGQFIVHRGLIVSIVQSIFTIIFYFCAIPVFNNYLLLGYATYYTFLPVFCLVFQQDVDHDGLVLKYPDLYQTLQKGRLLSARTVLIWTAQSLYQGTIVILLAILFFNDSFVNIVIINFSALLLIELLNLFTEIRRGNLLIYGCMVLSFMIYVASVWIFKEYFDLSSVGIMFVLKVVTITAIAWVPVHIIKCVSDKIYPSEASKINKHFHASANFNLAH